MIYSTRFILLHIFVIVLFIYAFFCWFFFLVSSVTEFDGMVYGMRCPFNMKAWKFNESHSTGNHRKKNHLLQRQMTATEERRKQYATFSYSLHNEKLYKRNEWKQTESVGSHVLFTTLFYSFRHLFLFVSVRFFRLR